MEIKETYTRAEVLAILKEHCEAITAALIGRDDVHPVLPALNVSGEFTRRLFNAEVIEPLLREQEARERENAERRARESWMPSLAHLNSEC